MKQYNNEKYIVSFTSFPKRFPKVCKMIFALLQQQKYKNFHPVITIYKDDMKFLTPELKLFIDNDLIELIIAEENLCPHLKYYYAMIKYWDKPIITLDDDRIYTTNVLSSLIEKYESLDYKSIVCNCGVRLTQHNGVLDDSDIWCVGHNRLNPNEKNYLGMAEGFAGVLYPPKAFEDLVSKIPEIHKILYHDDVYLKVLAIENKLPITQSNGIYGITYAGNELPDNRSTDLEHNHNLPSNYRVEITKQFNDKLIKAFLL